MDNIKSIKVSISTICILIIIIHLIFPDLTIDNVTLILLVTAILPWLASVFKSLELPWWYKVEFHDFKKIEEDAKKVWLIKEWSVETKYDFTDLSSNNPQLALAWLRIELEKSLRTLANKHWIWINKRGITQLTRELTEKEILSGNEYSVIADMIWTLNSAAHGEDFNYQIIPWITETWPKILDSINEKAK